MTAVRSQSDSLSRIQENLKAIQKYFNESKDFDVTELKKWYRDPSVVEMESGKFSSLAELEEKADTIIKQTHGKTSKDFAKLRQQRLALADKLIRTVQIYLTEKVEELILKKKEVELQAEAKKKEENASQMKQKISHYLEDLDAIPHYFELSSDYDAAELKQWYEDPSIEAFSYKNLPLAGIEKYARDIISKVKIHSTTLEAKNKNEKRLEDAGKLVTSIYEQLELKKAKLIAKRETDLEAKAQEEAKAREEELLRKAREEELQRKAREEELLRKEREAKLLQETRIAVLQQLDAIKENFQVTQDYDATKLRSWYQTNYIGIEQEARNKIADAKEINQDRLQEAQESAKFIDKKLAQKKAELIAERNKERKIEEAKTQQKNTVAQAYIYSLIQLYAQEGLINLEDKEPSETQLMDWLKEIKNLKKAGAPSLEFKAEDEKNEMMQLFSACLAKIDFNFATLSSVKEAYENELAKKAEQHTHTDLQSFVFKAIEADLLNPEEFKKADKNNFIKILKAIKEKALEKRPPHPFSIENLPDEPKQKIIATFLLVLEKMDLDKEDNFKNAHAELRLAFGTTFKELSHAESEELLNRIHKIIAENGKWLFKRKNNILATGILQKANNTRQAVMDIISSDAKIQPLDKLRKISALLRTHLADAIRKLPNHDTNEAIPTIQLSELKSFKEPSDKVYAAIYFALQKLPDSTALSELENAMTKIHPSWSKEKPNGYAPKLRKK